MGLFRRERVIDNLADAEMCEPPPVKAPREETVMEQINRERAERNARVEERLAEIRLAACDAERAVLSKADEYRAAYAADHERDKAAFKFSCKRRGAFLTVRVERECRRERDLRRHVESAAISLADMPVIGMAEGREPDDAGGVTYVAEGRLPFSGEFVFMERGDLRDKEIRDLRVQANLPSKEPRRGIICSGVPDLRDRAPEPSSLGVSPRTVTPFPRPARDDYIIFTGPNVTICTPAGMGQQVYDQIIDEIERGA